MSDLPERFSSFEEFQAEHDSLLALQETVNEADAGQSFWERLYIFITQGEATGAILDSARERRAAQSILNYWIGVLYRAHHNVTERHLVDFDPSLAPELPDTPTPYQGLAAFGETKQAYFFGRESLIRHMISQLDNGSRLLAAVGTSGSGKSSLVLAGLIPQLKEGGLAGSDTWYYVAITPGPTPWQNLVRAIQRQTEIEDTTQQLATVNTLLTAREFDQASATLEAFFIHKKLQPMVLVIDQFEELFTVCVDELQQRTFIHQVVACSQRAALNCIIILTMRTDFVDYVVRYPQFGALFSAFRVNIEALDINGLRAAIEKPAALVGLRFDEGIVDDIISKILGERAGLPLLQFTLLKLWQNRQRNRITWHIYETVGNPLVALERSAENFFTQLLYEDQLLVRRIFLQLVSLAEGREVTSNRVPLADIFKANDAKERVKHNVERLVFDELLLKVSGVIAFQNPLELSETTDRLSMLMVLTNEEFETLQIEIAHEALVRNWPRLVMWLEEEYDKVKQRLRIREAANHWQELQRDSGALYSALLLAEARQVIQDSVYDLTSLESEFLKASQAYIEEQQNTEIEHRVELARVQERAKQEALRTKRLRRWVVLLAIAALIPTALILINWFLQLSPWVAVANLPQGTVTAIAYSRGLRPNSNARYCIGTVIYGVACTIDGKTWNILQQNLPTGGLQNATEASLRGVNALAIDEIHPDYLYVFLWEKGLYKSVNGGLDWTATALILPRDGVIKVAAYGNAVGAIIRARETHTDTLALSLDQGIDWSLLTDPGLNTQGQIHDFVFVQTKQSLAEPPQLIIATDSGLYSTLTQSEPQWEQLAQLDNVHQVAGGESLEEGCYLSTFSADMNQSDLYFYSATNGLEYLTSFNDRIIELVTFKAQNQAITAYLLLADTEIYAVDTMGMRKSLSRPPTSLTKVLFNPDAAFALQIAPHPKTGKLWLLIGHTNGLLSREIE